MPIALFMVAFISLPLMQFKGLSIMPGDIGDARLNNYFLENIFQFIIGNSDSLWELPFFFPFPYVGGFSDNLFGSSPIYVIARFITGEPDTSFQIWFLFGYLANYSSAYYALRRLGGSALACSVGALIFSFALPTTAHAGHAQLHYRFGIPLAIVFASEFLMKGSWSSLLFAGLWTVWQFYSGVYMGFFTLLLMSTMGVVFVVYQVTNRKCTIVQLVAEYVRSWKTLQYRRRAAIVVGLLLVVVSMIILFYPYLQVSHLYGFNRSWNEIENMLPRVQSYILSDHSKLWGTSGKNIFTGLPMRHEHQMFVGVVPLLMVVLALVMGIGRDKEQHFMLMSWTLVGIIALTLYVGGVSFWYIFHGLPLASAIRAMTRLDQVLLFPIGYLAGFMIDTVRIRYRWRNALVVAVILPLLIVEFASISMPSSSKIEWRERVKILEKRIPKNVPQNGILFVAQINGPFYADEIDAMWVALNRGMKTLNGYSGHWPPGYSVEYGQDCKELAKRVMSYLNFIGRPHDSQLFGDIMWRVVPIGFDGCDQEWDAEFLNVKQ